MYPTVFHVEITAIMCPRNVGLRYKDTDECTYRLSLWLLSILKFDFKAVCCVIFFTLILTFQKYFNDLSEWSMWTLKQDNKAAIF